MIRPATLSDLDALVTLEQRCFETDRLSRRNFRHLLARGHASTLVLELDGQLCAYVMVLFRSGISLARLYSIAVDPAQRGRHLSEQLVAAAEALALGQDCVLMRLEIRADNPASIGLFKKLGYRPFGTYAGYYEDRADALRFQKYLAAHLDPAMARVPYYGQSTEFTCGPAAMMMAMKALRPDMPLGRRLELRLWRESTTIYMTSGHGGCGPHGLAVAAYRRGFGVKLFLRREGPLFLDSVRSAEKKEVMRLVQEDQTEELAAAGVPVEYRSLNATALQAEFECGGIPVVLISSYRMYREKFPHWVVVTGFGDRYVYVSDPYVDTDTHKSATDCINVPIPKQDFDRMTRYGKSGQEAVLILYPRGPGLGALGANHHREPSSAT
jgi:ribosomal protein S18 acetylase RimI-like enzyme